MLGEKHLPASNFWRMVLVFSNKQLRWVCWLFDLQEGGYLKMSGTSKVPQDRCRIFPAKSIGFEDLRAIHFLGRCTQTYSWVQSWSFCRTVHHCVTTLMNSFFFWWIPVINGETTPISRVIYISRVTHLLLPFISGHFSSQGIEWTTDAQKILGCWSSRDENGDCIRLYI